MGIEDWKRRLDWEKEVHEKHINELVGQINNLKAALSAIESLNAFDVEVNSGEYKWKLIAKEALEG